MSTPISWPFIGNTRLGRLMLDSWQTGSLPAVMIWRGPVGIGKASAASWLAQTVLCQAVVSGPCGQCSPCRQVIAGTYPGLVVLTGHIGEPIGIEDVRGAAGRFRWSTIPGEHRWWIITDAEHLTEAATNAMLKFFEEPPADLHIIVTTAQPDRLLPTILSRAAVYYWHTATDQEMETMRPLDMTGPSWSQLLARSAGRPGQLKKLLADPGQSETEAKHRDLLLEAMASGRPARLARQLSPDDMAAVLHTWELVIREILLAKMDVNSRRLWPQHPTLSAAAANLNLSEALRLSERYLNRYQLLQQHVQPRFILEDLQLV